MKKIFAIILTIFLLTGCSGWNNPKTYVRTEMFLGTFVQIKVAESGDVSRRYVKDVVDNAFIEARNLEKKVNIFDPVSELNALNLNSKLKVSSELFHVIERSLEISKITSGAFDVTVTPILKANGFYKNIPDEILSKIPDNFDGVGWKNISLDTDRKTVTLDNGAWIDLCGIAKGYIVDKIAKSLNNKGINNYLINAGGDIYCGDKLNGETWKIGVKKPGVGQSRGVVNQNILLTLGIKNMAVATSGDYENVVIDKFTGETISHIIEPALDKAKKEAPSSVTVIAPTCEDADAFATAMMVIEKDKAVELAGKIDSIEVIVIDCSSGNQSIKYSSGAEKYIVK